MKYIYSLIIATALFMTSVQTYAMDRGPAKTRQEAITRAKTYVEKANAYVAKLEKMTDKEWAEEKAKREEHRAKRQAKMGGNKIKTEPAKEEKAKAPVQ